MDDSSAVAQSFNLVKMLFMDGTFASGIILGALFTCFLVWILRKICCPADVKIVVEINKSLQKNIVEKEKTLAEKDERLDMCHREIDSLREQLSALQKINDPPLKGE